MRVVADEDALHLHPGEAALVFLQVVDEVIADVAAQGDRGAAGHRQLLVHRPAHLAQRHVGQRAEPGQLGSAPSRLASGSFCGLTWSARLVRFSTSTSPLRSRIFAARRFDPERAGAVVVRLFQVLLAGEHLQVPEAEEEHREEGHGDADDDGDAQRQAVALGDGRRSEGTSALLGSQHGRLPARGARSDPRPAPVAARAARRGRSASRGRRRRCS